MGIREGVHIFSPAQPRKSAMTFVNRSKDAVNSGQWISAFGQLAMVLGAFVVAELLRQMQSVSW
jgi:hypothetical protein